jgi:PAS domain S-box-containing protein
MLLQRLPYLLVYFSALILSGVVFYFAWKNRSGKGIQMFAWSILLEISWILGYIFEVTSSSLAAKVFWDNFQYIGAFLAPVFLICFAIEFTEIQINTRRLLPFLSIVPALVLLAVFSYQFPGLVRLDPQIEPGAPFDELTYGFGPIALLGYICVVLVSVSYLIIVILGFFRKVSVSRQQLAFVLLGTLIPIVGPFAAFGPGWEFANQSDISPLTFALSNGVIALAILRFRLFNVIPVARQVLFDSIEDLLIFLDNEDRILDANPSALKAFGSDMTHMRGIHIATLMPELYARFKDVHDAHVEIETETHVHYDLKITPIYDRQGDLAGRLIAAHDITLRKKVEQDLQKTSRQNQHRALQFRAIAQVASSISSVQELERTLTQIATTLSLQLGHYHIGIFMLDSTYQFAILKTANSEGGQKMLGQGYRLGIGEPGIVSTAITTGKAQIALDVDASEIFHVNPFLPNTRSEVALPIRLSGEMIGVLDIQSLQQDAFATDDLEVFEILASQVGIAIQNARLYEQNVQALKEIEEAYRRQSGSTWSGLIRQLDVQAYAYDGVSSHPVSETLPSYRPSVLSVPVTVRGQVVGNLRLNPLDPNRSWTEDERAITQAVAERAALALEAARLLEDAQKRASRETFLSEMASKLSTSFQLDSILRDTVEELGQSLSGSTVSFQLVNPSAQSMTDPSKANGQSDHRNRTGTTNE